MSPLLKKYQELSSKRELLRKSLEDHETDLATAVVGQEVAQKARAVLQHVAQQTQNNLKVHLDDLVTLALSCIWPLEFDVNFETKRGKTECTLSFKNKNGDLMNPTESSAGGAVDVASFALRCSFLQLQGNRKVLILDEPFKFVSRNHLDQAAEMLRLLTDRLGLQVIMVTHIPEFIEVADRQFKVEKKDGISSVRQV